VGYDPFIGRTNTVDIG